MDNLLSQAEFNRSNNRTRHKCGSLDERQNLRRKAADEKGKLETMQRTSGCI